MRKYPAYKALIMSFYSKELYRDVLRNWQGIGFMYVLLLSFILSIIMSAVFIKQIHNYDATEIAQTITSEFFDPPNLTFEENLNRMLNIMSQIPAIEIHDGIAKIDEHEPYFITDPISDSDLAIIDTSGEYHSLEGTDAYILLTKTRVVIKKEDGREEVNYLSEIKKEGKESEENVNELFSLLSQIPVITITNGTASIEEDSPFFIYGPDDQPIAIIDTEGTYNSLDDTGASLLITSDKIFFENLLDNTISETNIADINAELIFETIKSIMIKALDILIWFMPFFGVPILTLAYFVTTIIKLIIIALAGLAIGKILKLPNFEYEDSLRICAVTLTPIMLLSFIIPRLFTYDIAVLIVISIAYIYFALSANQEDKV